MTGIAEWVWRAKYALPTETSLDQTWMRVAKAVAAPEGDSDRYAGEFFDVMSQGWFIPAGRIIAGAGTGRDVTLFNCYVMGTIDDSMAGIMSSLSDAAMTLRAGGGVGMDFSTLRPRGARVKSLDADASGPVSFMDMWNSMCGTIMSAGARRGAMMGVLRCDHPDIMEFIEAKRQPGRLTNFNVSVAVTDELMASVKTGGDIDLRFNGTVYRSIPARDLWEAITASTHESSEPGVLFIDRINERNPLREVEVLNASNPCGEQLLPPFGACLLGSINLAKLIDEPFTSRADLNITLLADVCRVATRFLDNVIDISRYPLPAQQEEAHAKRRIGIGITGLADALVMMGVRYGSKPAQVLAGRWMEAVYRAADEASTELGKYHGCYPLACVNDRLPQRRNSHLTSIQPTGTTSLLAGNVSSGIEPVFDWSYTRRVLQPDGSKMEIRCDDYAYGMAPESKRGKGDEWVTAMELSPSEHLAMVAAVAPYVDSGISKTINCPADMGIDEFRSIYEDAYALGLKGCTTYRPTAVRGAVLVKDEAPKPVATEANVIRLGEPLHREEVLTGRTYKIKPDEHAIYITINDIEHQGRTRPFEIFVSSKAADSYPWVLALTRMISAVWRKGGDISFVAEELKQVFDPRGGFWQHGRHVPSVCAAIGAIIERHMHDTGALDRADQPAVVHKARHCPKCQTGALRSQEGCLNCDSCDYTKCG